MQAIEKGDPEGAFSSWLESLPASSDEKTTILNTIRYNRSSTALHLAAEYNQPAIARLLLEEGAGRYLEIISFPAGTFEPFGGSYPHSYICECNIQKSLEVANGLAVTTILKVIMVLCVVDPNIKRTDVSEDADDEEESKENDSSALHIACSNSAEADISDLVQLLVENRYTTTP